MKKFLALILATMMVLTVCATALAADVVYFKQNPLPAQAVRTALVTDRGVYKAEHDNYLYIRHYLWSDASGYYGSNNHTNYFQAALGNREDSRLGGNWLSPDTANYVKSSSILTGRTYGVACRGNTKYADAGIPVIRISGYTNGDA